MGIPGFASRMNPYKLTVTIGRTTDNPSQSLAVVDGPSLAYAIAKKEGSVVSTNLDTVTQNRYAHLGKAVIEWLGRLRRHGYEM